jgi:dolichyl-diphosphooligosaccharide--protein glycosyltransferase
VRAFDPWLQLKLTSYITENGISAFFTWYDDSTWVPFGRDVSSAVYLGVPFTTAFFYWFLNGIGISVELIYVAIVLPAFMGALTCMVMFLLGRELHSTSVGLFSALFLAFIPAFMQRTVVGFFDNECIGVFAIVLTSYFFIKSTKKGSMRSAPLYSLHTSSSKAQRKALCVLQ